MAKKCRHGIKIEYCWKCWECLEKFQQPPLLKNYSTHLTIDDLLNQIKERQKDNVAILPEKENEKQ